MMDKKKYEDQFWEIVLCRSLFAIPLGIVLGSLYAKGCF